MYLEPGVGGSRQEEAGETPDGVRERSPPGEVRERDENPLSEHVLLVLLAGRGSEDHLENPGQEGGVWLAGGDELRDDPVDDVTGGEEINEDLGQDLSQELGLGRARPADAVEQDGHLLHHQHQHFWIRDGTWS